MSYIFKKFFVVKRVRRIRKRKPASLKSKKEYTEKKELARELVVTKLYYWKTYYKENFNLDFTWNRVSIKNSKTRWGSCSSKKNLNFSYKIIDLKEGEQNYLIVHELCHLLQMNHSDNFWNLVELSIKDYKKIRHGMRKYNLS